MKKKMEPSSLKCVLFTTALLVRVRLFARSRWGWHALDVPTGLAGPPWAEAAQRGVAQCEIKYSSSAGTSAARSLGPEFEICESASVLGHPGHRTRDRTPEGVEVGTSTAFDVRLPRSCRGRSEARVGWHRWRPRNRPSMSKSNIAASSSPGRRRGWHRVAAEFSALTEAKGRLQSLEAEQAAATSLGTISACALISRLCRDRCDEGQCRRGGRRETLRSAVSRTNGQRPCLQWQPFLHIKWGPDHVQSCREESGEALVFWNKTTVIELTSRVSDDAARLSKLMGVMVVMARAGQSRRDFVGSEWAKPRIQVRRRVS